MRSALDYLVDTLMTIAFLAIAFIGVLLAWFIPKAAEAPGYEKYLWGLHRHEWGDLHHWICMAFIVLVILHLVLHWTWLKTSTRQRLPRSILLWFLIVLLAAAALILVGTALYPKGRYDDAGEHRQRRGAGWRQSF